MRITFHFVLLSFIFFQSRAAQFVVSNNADAGPGSLRQAITDANLTAAKDTITFSIADGSVPGRTITVLTPLPTVSQPLVIDGSTQPNGNAFGFTGARIWIENGTGVATTYGITVTSRGVEIYGLLLSAFARGIHNSTEAADGMIIGAAGKGNAFKDNSSYCIYLSACDSVTLQSNFIGLDTTGTLDWATGTAGIYASGSTTTVVQVGGTSASLRNYIAGNSSYGIYSGGVNWVIEGNYIGTDRAGVNPVGNGAGLYLTTSSGFIRVGGANANQRNLISGNTGNGVGIYSENITVIGNYIGTDVSGTLDLGNGADGIYASTSVMNTVIGGSNSGEGNLCSGNNGYGMQIYADTARIQGNRVGVNYLGTAAVGNTSGGIYLSGSNGTVVGGSGVSEGNQISGNLGYGIYVLGATSTVSIYGNKIGTDPGGNTAIPNASYGVYSSANATIIGGGQTGEGNLISGNGNNAIQITGDGVIVQGNRIGTTINGVTCLPNTGYGIYVNGSSSLIGGSNPGQGNTIGCNTKEAVYVLGTALYNKITRNSMFCNSSTNGNGGINLLTGANNNMAAPVLVTANATNCSGTAPASATVEVFRDDTCSKCEGKLYAGSVQADLSGNWSLTGSFSGNLTATATDAQNNTSKFSSCMYTGVANNCPSAVFSYIGTACRDSGLTFTDNSIAPAGFSISAWNWTFGDGGTANTSAASHSYLAPGTYVVKLVVTSGNCSDSTVRQVVINSGPSVAFSPVPDSAYCVSHSPVNLAANPGGGTFSGTGVSGSLFTPSVAGPGGPYSIRYTLSSGGCPGTTTANIRVDEPPVAAFTQSGVTCADSVFSFTDASTPPSGGSLSAWNWNFGDGASSTQVSPSHAFAAGNFTVILTAYSGSCSDTASLSLSVNPNPVPAFAPQPDSVLCETEAAITLSATPAGGAFTGTGVVSAQFDPSVAGTGGPYTVTYSYTSPAGCSAQTSVSIRVTDPPVAAFTSTPTTPGTYNFTNTSQGATSWTWDFGDGNTSFLQNPSHTWSADGSYIVCLHALNAGCSDSTCDTLSIVLDSRASVSETGILIHYDPNSATLGFARGDASREGTLYVSDLSGMQVTTVSLPAGAYRSRTDLHALSSGIYIVTWRSPMETVVRRIRIE